MNMLAADSGGVDVEAVLSFDATANAYEDGELVIKISSVDPPLHCTLVGYCLSDETTDQLGYVLRKGVLDKVSGVVRIDRSTLSGSCGANFEKVTLSEEQQSELKVTAAKYVIVAAAHKAKY